MAANEKTGINVISVDQLAAVIKNKIEKILIIDSRSFLEFNTCHITNAVNVCCSKIVKRRLQQDKVPVKELLMNTCQVMVHDSFDVVVYDQNSHDSLTISSDSFLHVLLTKLKCVFQTVNLLQGGFLEFQSKYPTLCEDKTRKCVTLTSMSQPCLPISNTGPTRILPFLYLGSQHDAMNKELLKDHNITYELNVSAACPKPDFIPEGHFLRIPVNDNYSEKLLPHFPLAFQFVDKVREANGCVLIHCLAGISRSPTVAIAYIMQYLHMSSDDAYRYVKSKRATISPNFNFLGQLLEYEHQLRKENVLKNKSHLYSSSSGQGNKRHCRNAMRGLQKLDLKFSTQSKSCDGISLINAHEIKSGEQSPTSALAKLSFTNSDKDINSNQKENLLESNTNDNHLNKNRTNACVQKSNSTSNLRLSVNNQGSSGRRLSFDAGNKLNLSDIYCQEFSHGGFKSVSFEGLKGIPISSLDNINFTPCQTSKSNNSESRKKSRGFFENGLLHSQPGKNSLLETNCCKNHNVNFSMQTQVWHSSKATETYSGIFKHLHNPMDVSVPYNKPCSAVENPVMEENKNTVVRESSPRPANILISPLIPVEYDDDEGIDLNKESDEKPKIEHLPQGMQVLGSTCESGNIKTTEQGEFLESSYDSGVYPSPTQFVPFVSDIFSPSKLEKNDWLNTYKETSNELTRSYFSDIEKNKTLINLSLHSDNVQKVCNSSATSDATRSFTPIEKFSFTTTTVFKDKNFQINGNQKEDRLYRAHSCPGIVGFIHCTSSVEKPDTSASFSTNEIKNSQMRRLKLSSVDREIRLRNRYSCGSLDYYNEGRNSTFDSCPDFVHYGNCQKDRNSNNNHEQPSLTAYHPFIQNTGIIQVS